MSTWALMRAVGKCIYEPDKFSAAEERLMQDSFNTWVEAIKWEKEKAEQQSRNDIKLFGKKMFFDHKYTEEELQLEAMASMLRDNMEGKLEEQKALFKRTGVDYKKYLGFPEAYTEQDFINGQKALEESIKANPDEHRNPKDKK